jgi:ribosome-associated translation inhibitor RaiA
VTIEVRGPVASPALRAQATDRMTRLLARFGIHSTTARAVFVDENGPKGGMDIRCALTVQRPARPVLRVESMGETPWLAFAAAFAILERRLEQDTERRRESRRHPKKYFIAKRLLATRGLRQTRRASRAD